MTYREVVRKLSALGCHELDLKLGTVRSAVRQLAIDWQDFHDA
jgi:hypothetical protein